MHRLVLAVLLTAITTFTGVTTAQGATLKSKYTVKVTETRSAVNVSATAPKGTTFKLRFIGSTKDYTIPAATCQTVNQTVKGPRGKFALLIPGIARVAGKVQVLVGRKVVKTVSFSKAFARTLTGPVAECTKSTDGQYHFVGPSTLDDTSMMAAVSSPSGRCWIAADAKQPPGGFTYLGVPDVLKLQSLLCWGSETPAAQIMFQGLTITQGSDTCTANWPMLHGQPTPLLRFSSFRLPSGWQDWPGDFAQAGWILGGTGTSVTTSVGRKLTGRTLAHVGGKLVCPDGFTSNG